MTKQEELVARIDSYLGCGGLVNPELMEHDKVRDLLIYCRTYFVEEEKKGSNA